MNHEHGAHTCYCPSCGLEVEVEANVRCNSQICPECGDRMRAEDTGEYRGTSQVVGQRIHGAPPMGVVLFSALAITAIGFTIIAVKSKSK